MAVERASVATSPQPAVPPQAAAPSSASPDKPPNESMFTCQICFDDLHTEACRELGECAHKYCVGCMRSYLRIIATESKKFPIPCPDPSCAQALDPQLCIMALEGDDAELLSRLVVEKTHCKTMNYCANASCATPFDFEPPHPNASDDAWRIECPLCKTATCVRCKTIWHNQATCAEAKAGSAGAEELKELAKKENWKSCPKCGEVIERISGCNYMRCRCGSRFCYACGTPYKNALRNNRNPHGTPGCDCGLIVPRREGGFEARMRLNMQRLYGAERRHMLRQRRNMDRLPMVRRRRNNIDINLPRHLARLAPPANPLIPELRESGVPQRDAVRPGRLAEFLPPANEARPRNRYTHTASSVRTNPTSPRAANASPNRQAASPIRANVPNRRPNLIMDNDFPERYRRRFRGANYSEELDRFRRYLERERAFQTLAPVVPPRAHRHGNAAHLDHRSPRNIREDDVANLPIDLLAVHSFEGRPRQQGGISPRAREVIDVDQQDAAPVSARRSRPAHASSTAQEPRRILPMRRSRRVEGTPTLSDWLARRRGASGVGVVDDSGDPPRSRRRGLGPGAPWIAAPRNDANVVPPVVAMEQAQRAEREVEVIDVDEAAAVLEAPKKATRFRTSAQEDSIAPHVPPEMMEDDIHLHEHNEENMLPLSPAENPFPGDQLLFPQMPPQQQQREMEQQRERLHDLLGEFVNVQQGDEMVQVAQPPVHAPEQQVQLSQPQLQGVPMMQVRNESQNNELSAIEEAQFGPNVIVEL